MLSKPDITWTFSSQMKGKIQKITHSPEALISIHMNPLVTWHHTSLSWKRKIVLDLWSWKHHHAFSQGETLVHLLISLTIHQANRCHPGWAETRIRGSPTFSSLLLLWFCTSQMMHQHFTFALFSVCRLRSPFVSNTHLVCRSYNPALPLPQSWLID